MGSEATRDLATTSDFDEIAIADLDREKAQALADSLNASTGRGHVQAVYVDASNEDALVTLLRGQDVAVNTLTYHFGLQATRAAIRAGVNYLDLGGLHNTPKQLALDHEAQAAGVIQHGGFPLLIRRWPSRSSPTVRWCSTHHLSATSGRTGGLLCSTLGNAYAASFHR